MKIYYLLFQFMVTLASLSPCYKAADRAGRTTTGRTIKPPDSSRHELPKCIPPVLLASVNANLGVAACVQLPFAASSINVDEYQSSLERQRTFYYTAVKASSFKKIFPSVENPEQSFDDNLVYADSVLANTSFSPAAIIYADKKLLIIAVIERLKYGHEAFNNQRRTLIFSINSRGEIITGFVAEAAQGNEHHGSERHSTINKDLTVSIIEKAFAPPISDEAYYKLRSTWKFLKNGKLIKLKEEKKFSESYLRENHN